MTCPWCAWSVYGGQLNCPGCGMLLPPDASRDPAPRAETRAPVLEEERRHRTASSAGTAAAPAVPASHRRVGPRSTPSAALRRRRQ